MRLAEPTTTLTDYAMALVAWAGALWLARRTEGHVSRRAWVPGLALIGLSAALGGSLHGFAPVLTEAGRRGLWQATYSTLGAANLLLLVGIAWALLPPRFRRAAVVLFAAHFAVFAWLVMRSPHFGLVIQDYALTLAALTALAVRESRRGSASARWLFGAVAVSAFAAIVQRAGWTLHTHFNHNDIFHVLQSVGLWCYARAAAHLEDRGTDEGMETLTVESRRSRVGGG